jgi:DNA-binding beta-propeller fold protein YncE
MMYQFNFNTISRCVRNSLLMLLVFCFSTSLGAAELRVISGTGEAGFVDGTDARFNKPIRLAPFGPGRVLVADINNHAIRSVTIDGEVLTLAGGPDKQGHRDGPAAEAGFDSPHGVAVSSDGIIVVAGAASHSIRLLTPDNEHGYQVSTLAGTVGQSGNRDGKAAQALFNSPHGVVWEPDGGVLVVDIGNASIRRVKDGMVTTVARAGASKLVMPIDMMPASDGGYLIADAGSQKTLRWVPGETGEVISPATELAMPHGVADDADGNVFVAEIRGNQVTRLAEGQTAVRIAGTGIAGLNQDQLNKPAAVLVHDGFLWIADLNNHRISVMPLK